MKWARRRSKDSCGVRSQRQASRPSSCSSAVSGVEGKLTLAEAIALDGEADRAGFGRGTDGQEGTAFPSGAMRVGIDIGVFEVCTGEREEAA